MRGWLRFSAFLRLLWRERDRHRPPSPRRPHLDVPVVLASFGAVSFCLAACVAVVRSRCRPQSLRPQSLRPQSLRPQSLRPWLLRQRLLRPSSLRLLRLRLLRLRLLRLRPLRLRPLGLPPRLFLLALSWRLGLSSPRLSAGVASASFCAVLRPSHPAHLIPNSCIGDRSAVGLSLLSIALLCHWCSPAALGRSFSAVGLFAFAAVLAATVLLRERRHRRLCPRLMRRQSSRLRALCAVGSLSLPPSIPSPSHRRRRAVRAAESSSTRQARTPSLLCAQLFSGTRLPLRSGPVPARKAFCDSASVTRIAEPSGDPNGRSRPTRGDARS